MTTSHTRQSEERSPSAGRWWRPDYRRLLGQNIGWMAAAVVLFLLGLGGGFVGVRVAPESSLRVATPLLRQLETVAGRLIEADNPLTRTWVIFGNNLRATVVIVGGGVALGLVPLLALLGNGIVTGFLLGLATGPPVMGLPDVPSDLALFVASVLPHGIIELPALLIGAAWGLKLGLAPVLPRVIGRRGPAWRTVALETVAIFWLVAALLLLAAAVEANVTLALVRGLRGLP